MSKSFRGKIKNKANSKKTNLQLLEEALNHYGPRCAYPCILFNYSSRR